MTDRFSVPHFETGIYSGNSTFLADEEYGRALDTFVKGCVDVLLTDAVTGEVGALTQQIANHAVAPMCHCDFLVTLLCITTQVRENFPKCLCLWEYQK
jgi:hypothetical protein